MGFKCVVFLNHIVMSMTSTHTSHILETLHKIAL